MLVNDDYRKNDLSVIPGGVTVHCVYESGRRISYDKIKNTQKYIRALRPEDERYGILCEIWIEDKNVWLKGNKIHYKNL